MVDRDHNGDRVPRTDTTMGRRIGHGRLARAALVLALALGSPAALAAAPPVPRLELCEGLVDHTRRVRVAPVARPPFLRRFLEPAFSTRVVRISDSRPGQVHRPPGDGAAAWNVDESLLLLHRHDADGARRAVLLDGTTYAPVEVLELPGLATGPIHWSRRDPRALFYATDTGPEAGRLTRFDVDSGAASTVADFAPSCRAAGLEPAGGLLAGPSADDGLFGYRCGVKGGRSLAIAHDAREDASHALRVGDGTDLPADRPPRPTADGRRFLLGGHSLDARLEDPVRLDLADPDAPHALGARADGRGVLFQSAASPSPGGCDGDVWNGVGLLVEHDLESGACRPRVSRTGDYPATPTGTELSAAAFRAPGWIALSGDGSGDREERLERFLSARSAPLLFSEVYLADAGARGDLEPCRIAHHRSFGADAANADYDPALGRPGVTSSPRATRAVFASDWYDSGLVDAYVVELPAFTPHDLAGTWVDADDPNLVTRIAQAGTRVAFSRAPRVRGDAPFLSTDGAGALDEDALSLDYTVRVGPGDSVGGSCAATVVDAARRLDLDCEDRRFGRVRLSLVRP